MLWRFKVASPLGEGFPARRATQALQTHVHVKTMSDVSRDIGGFECHQSRQKILILVMGKFFPDTNMPDMRPLLIQ